MNGDWIFQNDQYVCSLRAAGVLMRGGKVLLQCERDRTEFAVPGGHVKAGETSAESLKREFLEETGCAVDVKQLLWTEECFWEWNGLKHHNITFYYQVEFMPGEDIPEGFLPHLDNPGVLVGWIDVDRLDDIMVYPEFLKEEIKDLKNVPKHFVTRA